MGVIAAPQEAEEGDIVIVRSHGESRAFFEEAEKRGLEVINATCPFVERIHRLVEKAWEEDQTVVIVGDKDHPEVKGINGWCRKRGSHYQQQPGGGNRRGGKGLSGMPDYHQKRIAGADYTGFRGKNICLQINNTICGATKERQEACRELAEKSDAMVIIGGRCSSNTQKLYEISKKSAKIHILLKIFKIYH